MSASGDDLSSLKPSTILNRTQTVTVLTQNVSSLKKNKVLKGKRTLVASAYDRVKFSYIRLSVLFNDSKGRLNL